MAAIRIQILPALLGLLLLPRLAAAGSELVAASLDELLAGPGVQCGEARLDRARLGPYYGSGMPMALWVSERGPGERAQHLRTALHNAGREGLPVPRYWPDDIGQRWAARDPGTLACLDVLLTAAFDRYSRDLRLGQIGPTEADPSWELRPDPFDPVAALHGAKGDREFRVLLESLPPPHTGYERLRTALARYHRLAGQGGWPVLPPGPDLAPGDVHAQVVALRSRLRIEGDLSRLALSFGTRYDTTLVMAVKLFQRRHGIDDDGVVGANTRAALNVTVNERVAQLRRAMERWRWLPRDLGSHNIQVNTAGFELVVHENNEPVLRMRTINGTPDQATPSFTGTLRSLIINPYWYVPERIAHKRLWPRAQRDTGYLASHGFRVYDSRNGWRELDPAKIDWRHVDDHDPGIRLRQDPGPINLMGRLSFVFPNPHDIFLHDTPQRALFERDTRTFSEGCVRIENAMALALHALRRLPEWTQERIQADIDAMHHHNLTLPEPIPVYVLYLPSWIDEDGTVQFRGDPYGRERVLARVFAAQ